MGWGEGKEGVLRRMRLTRGQNLVKRSENFFRLWSNDNHVHSRQTHNTYWNATSAISNRSL